MRINEDYIDIQDIQQDQLSVLNDDYFELDKWLHGGQKPPFDLYSLPDSFYEVSDKFVLTCIIDRCIEYYGTKCNLNWVDVSNIHNMDQLFRLSSFDGDISRWDVSNVRYMAEMFEQSKFNSDISGWDVSKVEDMRSMFASSYFNQDISGWNTSSVLNMMQIFFKCPFNQDISGWDISNVMTNTEHIFDHSVIKDEYKPKINKKTRINEDYMDIVDRNDIIDDDLSINVKQNVQWLLDGLGTNIDFSLINKPIYRPKYGKELRTLIRMCVKKYGTECSLNWIDVSGRHNFSYMFYNSKFNGDISKWDVSEAIDMYQMFAESEFNGNLSSWDVSQVENMSYMFFRAKFNNDSLANWDVRNVKDMNAMFKFSDFNGDISEWELRRVKFMNNMFYQSKFDRDISGWYVKFIQKVDMFDGCPIREEYKPLSMQR